MDILILSSRIVICSCFTRDSTSLRMIAPDRNLPRNYVALFLALVKRDCLYLVMFTGVVLYVSPIVQSCDSVGGSGCGTSNPSAGMIAGGSIGAVVGQGGNGGKTRLTGNCFVGNGPGDNDGPA